MKGIGKVSEKAETIFEENSTEITPDLLTNKADKRNLAREVKKMREKDELLKLTKLLMDSEKEKFRLAEELDAQKVK